MFDAGMKSCLRTTWFLPVENTLVLIVEHDIDRVLGVSQQVTVMNQGEVLMTGTPEAVRGAVLHRGPAAPLLTDLDYRKKILWPWRVEKSRPFEAAGSLKGGKRQHGGESAEPLCSRSHWREDFASVAPAMVCRPALA